LAQTKKKPAAKPGGAKKNAAPENKPPQKAVKNEAAAEASRQRIAVILSAAFALFVCVIAIPGQSVWLAFHNALFGGLGACAWAIPASLLVLCVLFASKRDFGSARSSIICSGVFVIFLCAVLHIGFNDEDYINLSSWGVQISDAWDNRTASLLPKSGGVLGALIGKSVVKLFGRLPAIITLGLLLFVTLMFLLGLSIPELFRNLRRPVKYAGAAADARIERGMKRREQTRRRRRFNKERTPPGVFDPNNPNIELGPRPAALGVSESDNYLPDFIAPDNAGGKPAKAERTRLSSGSGKIIKPPVLLPIQPSSVDLAEIAEEDSKAKKDKSRKQDKRVKEEAPEPAKETDELISVSDIYFDKKTNKYRKPPISYLSLPTVNKDFGSEVEIEQNSRLLLKTLDSFGIKAAIVDVCRGPSVTRYELLPADGVKISKITNLSDDLAMRLASSGVRIEAPIPNKAAIGIEVPNKAKASVVLREIVDTDTYRRGTEKSLLNVALGKDITGNIICADLSKMPHLLIAGTTGSGKSVCINSMIMSLLYNADPDQVKLLMIDPKQVEFTVYSGIPHLLVPVVSDPRKASGALNWAVGEMLKRYKTFSEKNVRDITGYNKLADKYAEIERMNRIVIFIDELSDLMMVAQNEVEDAICRLAQMARAAGMHLVIATQRPSVDVITGVIKANIPSRIALSVSSQIDSRTIIDMAGAEKLLGYGDMLFNPVGLSKPLRVQGSFVSDGEVENVVDFIKSQKETVYDEAIMDEIERQSVARKKTPSGASDDDGDSGAIDEKLLKAIEVVVEAQMASTTLLQRKLSLGYARAARLIDELEERKIVGPFEGSKPRKVLLTKPQWMEQYALSGDGLSDSSGDYGADVHTLQEELG